MKRCFNFIVAAALTISGHVAAQECTIPITVIPAEQATEFPEVAENNLMNVLRRVATQNGLVADAGYTQFGLTAKFDELSKEVLSSSPTQISRKLGVTIYVVDLFNEKVFSSGYLEVAGVGTNETKSWVSAMGRINNQQTAVKKALSDGISKIKKYYDQEYPNILKRAKAAMSQQRYEEALSLVNSIPPCCNGYDEASAYGESVYTQYLDKICQNLLAQARSVWAAGQDKDAAADAAFLISQIDAKSSSYAAGQELLKEIKAQVRSDLDLEMREKYRDEIALRKQGIDAWRQVGVAYGNGQKPITTHVNWIR